MIIAGREKRVQTKLPSDFFYDYVPFSLCLFLFLGAFIVMDVVIARCGCH